MAGCFTYTFNVALRVIPRTLYRSVTDLRQVLVPLARIELTHPEYKTGPLPLRIKGLSLVPKRRFELLTYPIPRDCTTTVLFGRKNRGTRPLVLVRIYVLNRDGISTTFLGILTILCSG